MAGTVVVKSTADLLSEIYKNVKMASLQAVTIDIVEICRKKK